MQPAITQHNHNDVRINKLVLVETGGYKDQFIRSFEVNADNEQISKIEHIVDKTRRLGSSNVKPTEIANEVPDLILPSSGVIGKVNIPYGWGEKRFRFLLEVVERGYNNNEKVTIIQGYTEYPGASYNTGAIDENMRFYANSVVELRRYLDMNTGMLVATPIAHYNIIHLPDGNVEIYDVTNQHYGHPSLTMANLVTLRPEDMLATMSSLYSMDLAVGEVTPSGVLIQPVDSAKGYNIPSRIVADTLTGLLKSKSISQISWDGVDTIDNAVSVVKQHAGGSNRSKNNFWKMISALYGYQDTNVFTFRDLKQIDPNVDNVTKIIAYKEATILNNPVVQQFGTDSEDFYRPTLEARMAVLISEAITSLLSNNLLSKITLTFSNLTGEFVTGILDARTIIDGINITGYAEKLRIEFESYVAPVITISNQMSINLMVDSDLTGDTVIAVSYNGNPETVFRIPTFADSVFNPLIETKPRFEQNVVKFKEITDIVQLI